MHIEKEKTFSSRKNAEIAFYKNKMIFDFECFLNRKKIDLKF